VEIFKPKTKDKKPFSKMAFGIVVIIILQVYQIANCHLINFRIKNDHTLQIGESPEDFCAYVIKSIIEGETTSRMFDEETYKILKADPEYFGFKNEEKVKLVKVKEDQCRVVTESPTGDRRGFFIILNKSLDNPFYYKALRIDENEEEVYGLVK
jgi:hypothetical protein